MFCRNRNHCNEIEEIRDKKRCDEDVRGIMDKDRCCRDEVRGIMDEDRCHHDRRCHDDVRDISEIRDRDCCYQR